MGQDWTDSEALRALMRMLFESGDVDSANCIADIVLHKVADDYQQERARVLLEHGGITGVASSALQRALQKVVPPSEIVTSDEEWSEINTIISREQEQIEATLEELESKRRNMQILTRFMHLRRLENDQAAADAIQRLMMPPYPMEPDHYQYYRHELVSPARRARDVGTVERCIDEIRFNTRRRGRKERMAVAEALDWLIRIAKGDARRRREAERRWAAAKSMIDDLLTDSVEGAEIADELAQSAGDLSEEGSVDESIVEGLESASAFFRKWSVRQQEEVRQIMRRNQ